MGTRGSPDASKLAPELRLLLDAIADWYRRTGLHPTLDELAGVLGSAKSTVSERRQRLRDLGLVEFDARMRSTRVRTDPAILAAYGLDQVVPSDHGVTNLARFRSRRARLGGIRAGQPLGTVRGERPWQLPERPPHSLPVAGPISAGPARTFLPDEDSIEVDAELVGAGQYALRVRGDSMVELGIHDGDQAVVDTRQPAHHGDLVAALLPSEHGDEDSAVLKIFELGQNEAWLVAANPAYAPIRMQECTLLGRVTTIIRRF